MALHTEGQQEAPSQVVQEVSLHSPLARDSAFGTLLFLCGGWAEQVSPDVNPTKGYSCSREVEELSQTPGRKTQSKPIKSVKAKCPQYSHSNNAVPKRAHG